MPKDFDFEEQAHRIESDEMLNDFYGAETIRNSPQQFVLDQVEKLNKDQRAAFDRISSAILDGDNRRLFFVEGAGGCGKFYCSLICYISVSKRVLGKTYLYNTLIRWILAGKPSIAAQKLLRNCNVDSTSNNLNNSTIPIDDGEPSVPHPQSLSINQENVSSSQGNNEMNILEPSVLEYLSKSCNQENFPFGNKDNDLSDQNPLLTKGKVSAAASTGIAALLLIGGGTVHRLFNVPNDVDDKTQPRMNAESKRADQIRNSDLIIIDVIFFVLYIVQVFFILIFI